jgi:ATP-dependent Clp protease adaptor protein ClpS
MAFALSNSAGLINLEGSPTPGIDLPRVASRAKFARLRRAAAGPIFGLLIRPVRIGWPGAAIWKAAWELYRWLRPGEHRRDGLGSLPVYRGDSNACAMLQLTPRPDSTVPSAVAASAVRMSNDENRTGGTGGPATSVITKVKPKTKRPNLYRVLILNDDYTPMEFVVHVLEKFFQKDAEAATKIMLHVHHHGIGECGVFTYEIAETKVTQVMDFARKHQHPLQCVMEKK